LGLVGDFTQRHDGVFVVVTVNGDRATGGNLARTMGGKHHQFEPVWNLVYAIFNRYAGHRALSVTESMSGRGLSKADCTP
jgi:hypothetical protein